MKNFSNLELFLHLFVLFLIQKMEPLYTFFTLAIKQNLWSKLQELPNSKILLPQNTPQSAFFGFPDNKENFEIINHLHLIFKYYLFKVQDNEFHRCLFILLVFCQDSFICFCV